MLSNQIVTFETVGGEGAKLSNFKPVDEDGQPLSNEISVQLYSNRGAKTAEYTWTLGEDIDEGFEDGWYDENQDEPKDCELPLGQGFLTYTTYANGSLVYSGEVDVKEIAIPVPRLLSFTGNIRPCEIKLSDLTTVDENDDPISNEISVQFYNERGQKTAEYTWALGEDIDEGFADGWYDENQDEPKDVILPAGRGFCTYTTYEGGYLKFPAIKAAN